VEDDKVFIYHNLENSRMLHSSDLQCIEVEPPVRYSFMLQKLVTVLLATCFIFTCIQ